MKIAYFDCFSGISGDMCLGAIVDAGVPIQSLKRELRKIPIRGYELKVQRVKRAGLVATKVDVVTRSAFSVQRSGGRKWKVVERIIQDSTLSYAIKQKGLDIFKTLFEAEAKVHGKHLDDVHLHELSGVDCIVDIFGTLIGLDMLGVEKIYSSPVNLGGGTVKTQHGILPVPAPAVVEILKGVPVYSTDIGSELTTPTGAVILKNLSSGFGDIPLMNIEKTGIGAGSKDFKDRPNVLRLFIRNSSSPLFNKITLIEANIDDMNPQVYEYVMEKLFEKGALDVFLTQVIMKKGRPGIKLTVLCNESDRDLLIKTILNETTTIGVRFYNNVDRVMLEREIRELDTEFGKVRIKISRLGKELLKASPEYEDCKKIAKRTGIPLVDVIRRITTQINDKEFKDSRIQVDG
ncbi:MAG: nickel pincer cofactor biosynthesis protein LarC [Thermodesulfovibrionales bacterium]